MGLEVYLEIDGEQKASLTTKELMVDVPTALRTASRSMTLYPGDIVGIDIKGTEMPVGPNSRIEAGISSVSIIRASFRYVDREA
jgi:2-keto-4-pentenoate hydratase/2-oxohepta-3-ene-1,7-dioic acid hydratase in catechol pathway